MLSWGTIMMAMAAVENAAGLLAARFFLGVTESGLFPGSVYLISLWYTRSEQALRNGLFFSTATMAGAFGGVLAYGIAQMEGVSGLHGKLDQNTERSAHAHGYYMTRHGFSDVLSVLVSTTQAGSGSSFLKDCQLCF
jgi:MFS family permease